MNIAYLTSEYRDYRLKEGDTFTYISNSFCREWVKQGHNVIVIHNASSFPKILYHLPQFVKNIYEKKKGSTWGSYDSIKEDNYLDHGVLIYRMPIKKLIPHSSPSDRRLNVQAERIRKIFAEKDFVPDVIIGQWISPQLELIYRLKDFYNCRAAVVLHGKGYFDSKNYPIKEYLSKIDKLGVRSETQATSVMRQLSLDEKPFVCYSGIPDEYVENYSLNTDKFNDVKKWRFAFVGRLVNYKKADVLIRALSKINDVDWELNIVGEGAQLSELRHLCDELSCDDKVIFHGKVSRNEVMDILSQCHCFVMISVGEVFGLVYLEAMGACCVTVASIGGGVDGVIKNGINGFLTTEGNEKQLEELLKRITHMSQDRLQKIVTEGYHTAIDFAESKTAEKYLLSAIGKQQY